MNTRRFILAASKTALTLGLLLSGCAGMEKNLQKPPPFAHNFGHILFNETPGLFPALKPAAPAAHAAPGNILRREGEQERHKSWAALDTKVPLPGDGLAMPPIEVNPSFGAPKPDAPVPGVQVPPVPQAPKKPKETEPGGFEIEEVPPVPAEVPKAAPANGLGDGSPSTEVLAAAVRILGLQADIDESRFLKHVLDVADVDVPRAPESAQQAFSLVKAVYEARKAAGRTFGTAKNVKSGDLVFFHNTFDRDSDGRADDWFTNAGVVEKVDKDGTLSVIAFARGQVRRIAMNLEQPSKSRDDSRRSRKARELNTALREKTFGDRPGVAYLAGELFASFAHVD